MKIESVKAVMGKVQKGSNIVVSWERPCKTKKTCPHQIVKQVLTIGRIGIDYNNLKAVQEKRENGELPEQSQPIWNGKGEWAEFPFLIRHVNSGKLYLRLYKGSSAKVKPKVAFFMDGQSVTMEQIKPFLLASETSKSSENADCFTCDIENLTTLMSES